MIANLKKYYNLKSLILLSPVLFFVIARFAAGFNGLYGQDSHEYFRYSRAITNFFQTGSSPGDYFWPVYYPILGSIFGFAVGNLFSLQFISALSLSCSLYFLFKIMGEVFGEQKNLSIYILITFLLSPLVFRNSLVVMSDLLTVFFIMGAFYFFIDYLHKTELNRVIFFSVFFTLAILTRYAALVVLVIPAIIIIHQFIRSGKFIHLLISFVIVVILSIPHILIREAGSIEFLRHSWLQDWSLSNFFKNNFITTEGTQHYRFPNIIYSFSSVFFPTYLVFGLVLLVLSERNLPRNRFWLISVFIVLLNALFLAGIPFQNQRYLLLAYPFVVISLFPGFERLEKILNKRKFLFYSAITVMLVLQVFYCFYYFKPVYERNKLEKRISNFVRNNSHQNVYAFDIDISFMSYDIKKNVINMWKNKIAKYKPDSIVIFNEEKFKEKWKGKNPMLNWNELKSNYHLNEIAAFGEGWKAYEVKSK